MRDADAEFAEMLEEEAMWLAPMGDADRDLLGRIVDEIPRFGQAQILAPDLHTARRLEERFGLIVLEADLDSPSVHWAHTPARLREMAWLDMLDREGA